jgi:peptide/nickel transport system permease protein
VKFIIQRFLALPVTLFVVTAVLYGIVMMAPVETRAELYMPKGSSNNPNLNPEGMKLIIIERYALNDPYPVQYARWVSRLVQGDWGWSPALGGDVLEALIIRTPATLELTIFAILFLVPLGILSGVVAGWKQGRLPDHTFRLGAFIGTSIPPFILGLVLIGIFYAGLKWFPPGRLSNSARFVVASPEFKTYTGLLTIDGLLNGQPEISVDAFRHLILPVITLSLAHWATLGRVTRVAMNEEMNKDYLTTARGKGVPVFSLVWIHALRNAMLPALNSTALSAASLIMGVFVIEAVFSYPGVSELITGAMRIIPDMPIAMGFAIYSVLLVLPLMLILDVIQGLVDPRIREGDE